MQKRIYNDRIKIVLKSSRLVQLLASRCLTLKEFIAIEHSEGRDPDTMIESSVAQHRFIEHMHSLFPPSQFVAFSEMTPDSFEDVDAVIVGGGDDTLLRVAHYARRVPIIGINSDPLRSHGGLLKFNRENMDELLIRLSVGDFRVEYCPTLKVGIPNGRSMFAYSQARIAHTDSFLTTRVALFRGKKRFRPLGSSGLLVVPPAGVTGHFKTACAYIPKSLRRKYFSNYSRELNNAYWTIQEPFVGNQNVCDSFSESIIKEYGLLGCLDKGEELTVTINSESVVACDTDFKLHLKPGQKLKIKLANKRDYLKLIS